MLTRVPLETVYEQIDPVVEQLREEADELVAAAGRARCRSAPRGRPRVRRAGGGADAADGPAALHPARRPGGAGPGAGEHARCARPICATSVRSWIPATPPQRRPRHGEPRSPTLFRKLRTALPPLLQETVTELEAICDERRQLADQKRLHHVLHGWLLVHVPLSHGPAPARRRARRDRAPVLMAESPPRYSTKIRAKRIALQYFKRPHPFRRWKLILSIAAPVLAALWLLVVAAARGDQRLYNGGPVSTAHAMFESDCRLCHGPGPAPGAPVTQASLAAAAAATPARSS